VEGDKLIAMAPVLEVWGKLDVLRIHENAQWAKYDEWAKDHFGHTRKDEGAT
jgi:hypothetical protein